jgi:hypothetical protein
MLHHDLSKDGLRKWIWRRACIAAGCPYALGDLAANLCLGLVQEVNKFHQIKTPN